MSAFHDIWIGDFQPKATRVYNLPWKQEGNWWESSGAHARNNLGKSIADSRFRMIVLGQFYEPVDLAVLMSDYGRYAKKHTTHLKDPAGHYIIFLYDNHEDNWHVFTNRFGTYHAYYSTAQKVITTYFLGLATTSLDKNLDWQGITSFLAMGFFPADRTYLQSIRIFSPASHYCFNGELQLISQERYWEWSYEPGDHTAQHYNDHIHDVVKQSISYAGQGCNIALPISGGLDSRMLAGTLSEISGHHNLWSFSYGYTPKSKEIRIAKDIAGALGFPFDSYIVPNYLFGMINEIEDAVEHFQYVDGTRQASVIGQLEEKADLVVGGHWGDVWMDDMHLDPFGGINAPGRYFDAYVVKKGSDWLLKEVAANFIPDPIDSVNDYFNTEISKYKHIEDDDFKLKAFKTDQWSFRWTAASLRMYQGGAFPVLPFYDNRLTDIFAGIPNAMLKGRKLQIEYIKTYHPNLAKITWQEYGRDLYKYEGFNNRNYLYRAAKKMQRTLLAEKPIQRNWEVFYLNIEGKKHLQDILAEPVINDIVNARKLKEMLDNFYQHPSAANGYTISMLHTLTLFLKKLHGDA